MTNFYFETSILIWIFVLMFSHNRFEYDKKMSELSCADEDHPLKPVESPSAQSSKSEPDASLEGGCSIWYWILQFSNAFDAQCRLIPNAIHSSLGTNQLCEKITRELDSVAVDWKSLRTTTACSCTTPFDQFSRKVNKDNLIHFDLIYCQPPTIQRGASNSIDLLNNNQCALFFSLSVSPSFV